MRSTYPEERVEKAEEIARNFAAKARRRYVGMADIEALEGAAFYGAARALATYDEERGVKFSTWAICKVRSEILEEARQQDHIPNSRRRKVTQAAREGTAEELPGWAERPASLEDLGFWLDDDWIRPQFERAAAPWDEEIPAPRVDSTAEEAFRRLRDETWQAWVALLPEREREVLRLYYWRDMTDSEIAEALGICYSRVHQCLHAGHARLREWLGGEGER
jgi:RNA polymerase sigma factor for flagellar operon FliA